MMSASLGGVGAAPGKQVGRGDCNGGLSDNRAGSSLL